MEILIVIVVLLFSAILHEVMHGYAADRLGDPTARLAGRLTLNPIPHIDPIGSILFPALLILSGSPIIFGSAKPVPINPLNFKDGKKDMALTALAGPFTNIILALAAAMILKVLPNIPILIIIFQTVALYNLILAAINLVPIPPLDGSRVVSAILPEPIASFYNSIEPFGIFIILFLLLFPIGDLSLSLFLNKIVFSSLHFLGI